MKLGLNAKEIEMGTMVESLSLSFDLTFINLTVSNCSLQQDEIYMDAVFNETVTLVELDEGLDTETFFLYVFLAAVIVLLLVGAQQVFASFGVSIMLC